MSAFTHIKCAGRTDVGRKRRNNEDAFGIFPHAGLFCVADGMGGGDDGEIASAAVIRAMEAYASSVVPPENVSYPIEDVVSGVRRTLDNVSRWIFNRAREMHLNGCGSTFVGLLLDAANPSEAVAIHAGDSRLYRIRGNSIKQITTDHSAAEMMGAKDENAVNPMFRGMILRAVGIKTDVEAERTPVPLREGDRIVICSDGLSKMLSDRSMLSAACSAGDVRRAADTLIDAANNAGGADNITAIVLDVGHLPPPCGTVPLPLAGAYRGEEVSTDPTTSDGDSPTCQEETRTVPASKMAGSDGLSRAPKSWLSILRAAIIACSMLFVVALVVASVLVVHSRHKAAREKEDACREETTRAAEEARIRELEASNLEGRMNAASFVAGRQETGNAPKVVGAATWSPEPADDEPLLDAAAAQLSDASAEECSSAFIRTVRKYSTGAETGSLLHRFMPMRDSHLPPDRRRSIAVSMTADVQDIVRDLVPYAKKRAKEIEELLSDFRTSEEFKLPGIDEKKRLDEFLEAADRFLPGDPARAETQLACAEILKNLAVWFR